VRRGLDRGVRYPFGTHDKSMRSGADEVKGITGYQGQDFIPGGIQDPNIIRIDHAGGNHTVAVLALQGGNRDAVVSPNIPQRPEKGIAMRGDPHIAKLTRERRTGNMSRRAPESSLILSFDDHHGEGEARDFEAADQAAGRHRQKAWRRMGRQAVYFGAARRVRVVQPALEIAALPPLERPGVPYNESAIP